MEKEEYSMCTAKSFMNKTHSLSLTVTKKANQIVAHTSSCCMLIEKHSIKDKRSAEHH